MSNYTKGRWLIRQVGTSSGEWLDIYTEGAYYDDGSELSIAETGTVRSKPNGKKWVGAHNASEIRANAKLIACAPEIAEMLLLFRGDADSWPLTTDMDALLRKAGVIK